MPATLDLAALRDPALRPIGEKVEAGTRLDHADGLALYATTDLLGLGHLADFANLRVNGDRVYFSANQHLNPTNVCVLRATCVFCSFARTPKEEGAYTRSLEQVFAEAEQARGAPTTEFHIVGGLHPKLRLSYYTDMLRGLKERHPQVHIKALTAVEIAHLARIEKTSEREVLQALKEAGLTSLPGGGAEVFSTAVRATIAERKLTGEEWIRVHRTAHELGIPTNCTMLYGHVETAADRLEHLAMLRALQDDTGGFLTYIPLAYHPDHNELGESLGRGGTATTGYEDLKNIAIGRLFLDNIAHVKTHWPMVTPPLSQVALSFGCDDVEGTVVYERVYHEAGAKTDMAMSYAQLVGMIRGAGRRPVERNSLYQPLRDAFDDAPAPLPREAPRRPAASPRALRLGRIPWINCMPVTGAVDRGIVPVDAELVTGTAAELNDLLAAGELDVSVVSAVEYARNAAAYHLLPDLGITADGPVHSVALFSRRPVEDLDGKLVLRTASSRTSALLLELLFRHRWRVAPRFATARAEPADLGALAGLPHEAVLVIGDAALQLQARGTYPVVKDLGAEWKAWTGLPFVFAVWAARREAPPEPVRRLHRALLDSRAWGLAHLDLLAADAARATGVSLATCRAYLGTLDYALGGAELEGLTTFFHRLAEDRLAPGGALSFITAA